LFFADDYFGGLRFQMAIIDTITYAGPFPVSGSHNATLHQIDDAGSQTHELLSQRVVIPKSVASSATEYSHSFAIGAWSAPASGYRTITIPAATHGLGTSINEVSVQEYDGTIYTNTTPDRVAITAANGQVELRVADGSEFAGRAILS
jgi:hypothetical protein